MLRGPVSNCDSNNLYWVAVLKDFHERPKKSETAPGSPSRSVAVRRITLALPSRYGMTFLDFFGVLPKNEIRPRSHRAGFN